MASLAETPGNSADPAVLPNIPLASSVNPGLTNRL